MKELSNYDIAGVGGLSSCTLSPLVQRIARLYMLSVLIMVFLADIIVRRLCVLQKVYIINTRSGPVSMAKQTKTPLLSTLTLSSRIQHP